MFAAKNDLPIGVFDSGVGGLTVLAELRRRFPNESFVYLGDTARIPYGTKSQETVCQYATSACDFLLQSGVKMLVVACNTVSALALPTLLNRISDIPIVGVVEPGASRAVATTQSGHILVLATDATTQARAYPQALHRLQAELSVVGKSCSLFVALAEEGWSHGAVAEATAKAYLEPILLEHPQIDTILLGCTHFPVLKEVIQAVVGPERHLVDSASATADAVGQTLQARQLMRSQSTKPLLRFYVTDTPDRFIRVAERFMSMQLGTEEVSWVDVQFSGQMPVSQSDGNTA